MENPATWGDAEHAVAAALDDHDEAMRTGTAGVSLVRRITDALREEGLLRE